MRDWMRATVAAMTVVAVVGVAAPLGRAGESVWLEGEAGKTNVNVNNTGWVRATTGSRGRVPRGHGGCPRSSMTRFPRPSRCGR